jgi:hypothetical protein
MLRTRITELGKLNFLSDGGLVCSVTLDEPGPFPPPFDGPETAAASYYWAWANQGELAIGDLVVHNEHGVARYRGRERLKLPDGEDWFLLEFAHGALLRVPATSSPSYARGETIDHSDEIHKLGREFPLSMPHARGVWKRPVTCWFEVVPNAYNWPGIRKLSMWRIGTPLEEWRRECVAYQKALHADSQYRQKAQEYLERQNREPQPLLGWWVYRGVALRLGTIESSGLRNRDADVLLVKKYVLRREREAEKLRREVEALQNCGSLEEASREPIPEHVRLFVWRRDKGQCVRCGSRERLEFDHIIPVVAGGSNTERNVQLLCEPCNRSKGARV